MPPKHHHAGHRSRLRARFAENPSVLPDHEILELLLFYALPQKDTNETAHKLLERFGSLSGVLYAPVEQISSVEGLGDVSATMFAAMKELFSRVMRESHGRKKVRKPIYDANAVGDLFLPRFANLKRERVMIIGLNNSFQVIADEWIAEGSRDTASFVITDVLEFIVRHKPQGLILAHNHLSGVSLPSQEDFNATDEVEAALSLIDIPLVDHLIFDGKNDFVSFAQSGNLRTDRPKFSVLLRDSADVTDVTDFMARYQKLLADIVKKKQTNEDKA
ncbi:MAG: DNA repair protein RadC [Clostridia bacterium]|nr:DNA repair protein RadC [Clostridia bacterium]